VIKARAAGRPRRGFTLLELVVALAAGALLLVSAMQLGRSIALTSRALRSQSAERMERVIAIGWLRARLTTADLPSPATPFIGREHDIEFGVSRALSRSGNGIRRRLEVDSGALMITSTDRARQKLLPSVRKLTVDYLYERGRTSPWLPTWTSSSTLPAALRLRLERDDESQRVDTLVVSMRVTL
jgi:prepilin-type N-terminal cleavage/methylation domain-containing protein